MNKTLREQVEEAKRNPMFTNDKNFDHLNWKDRYTQTQTAPKEQKKNLSEICVAQFHDSDTVIKMHIAKFCMELRESSNAIIINH